MEFGSPIFRETKKYQRSNQNRRGNLSNTDAKIMGEPIYKKHKAYKKIRDKQNQFSENNIPTLTRKFTCRIREGFCLEREELWIQPRHG